MEQSLQCVVFTKRAFNAIVTETISKHPIETGGIFLGYLLDNNTWIVVENVAPGSKSTHQSAYFEYDADFVTYLANVLANQYKGKLRILGLWHRHPGSMDVFSSTDDQTNLSYASDFPQGAISALVNCDPKWRMTMYHVSQKGEYTPTEWYVDDGDIIPPELLELRYTNIEDLPTFDKKKVITPQQDSIVVEEMTIGTDHLAGQRRPYGFADAFRDMKKIVNQLVKGYTYDE